ncbi:hypothetical protein [Streptomyces carpinensis]|uniref:hypothetical protein n=1 Tax=Streptomyces carpinensis TaxID=66369 RepID=UPI000A3A998D|nr:hypothetical protein [Streptomyces carpinensis]
MTGARTALAPGPRRVLRPDPGGIPPGSGPAAVILDRSAVETPGRCDRLRRGHQRLLAACRRSADALGVPVGAPSLTGTPDPR